MAINLYDYQIDAINRMEIGHILCGGVGSGKSITALAYYFQRNGGQCKPFKSMTNSQDLYIITTARKRDTNEWDKELNHFLLYQDEDKNVNGNKVVVDSWNNIGKYIDAKDAFFIFDEQRLIGSGAWVKAFYKIAAKNDWILLSATPGDCWMDYVPVFVANGFYRNITEFKRNHVVYARGFTKFPKIDRYVETGRLIRLRNKILVDMNFHRETIPHHESVSVDYDILEYKELMKNRWNKDKDCPIVNASELCYQMRKIINSHPSRLETVKDIFATKHKVIVFYNFDYELEILKSTDYISDDGEKAKVAEWNGHKHQEIPEGEYWVYLVQYTAGNEGWNCIKTDTIIFYSQNYSYKVMIQAAGRIDRLNTPYRDLYFYHLKSHSGIDLAIARALANKKKFNEGSYISKLST